MALPEYATVAEAAKTLQVSIGRVHQYIREQRLPAERCGKQLVIPRGQLAAFERQPRVRTGRPKKSATSS